MSILERRELLGMEKGIEKVAINLLKEGAEIALVVKATGLSSSKIEKLKENLKN